MTSSLKFLVFITRTSLLAQTVKNLSAAPKTWVGSLSQADLLEKGMATHSSILPRKSHGQRSLVGKVCGVTKNQTRLSD